MVKKTYFAIKITDLDNDENLETYDHTSWEIIFIKAYNYYEAKDHLKRLTRFEDYILVPKNTLKFRDIIPKSKED